MIHSNVIYHLQYCLKIATQILQYTKAELLKNDFFFFKKTWENIRDLKKKISPATAMS